MINKFGFVRWFAMSTWPCEVSFGLLRVLSKYDHSPTKARQVLKDQKVLEYLDYQLGESHEGDRLPEHRTQTLYCDQLLSKDDDEYLWKVSGHVFDLLMGLHDMDAEELLSDLEKFQLIKNIWLIIDSSIVKEYHATADEDTDPQNVVVHNYTQQSRQERWEQSGLIGKK